MSEKRIISVGEVLLFLIKKGDLIEERYFSNEAKILSILQKNMHKATFLTAIPKNTLGDKAKSYLLDDLNLDTKIVTKDGRQGLIFLNDESSIIDRKYSAFYFSGAMDYDFLDLFKDACWFHFPIDTLTVHDEFIKVISKVMKLAKKGNIKVSIDFRSNNLYWRDVDSIKLLNSIAKTFDYLFLEKEQVLGLPYGYQNINFEETIRDLYKKLNANELIIFDKENQKTFILNNGELLIEDSMIKEKEKGNFESYCELIASFIDKKLRK